MKKFLINLTIILLLLGAVILTNWQVRDKLYEYYHDFKYPNPEVYSVKAVNKIIDGFEKVDYDDLDRDYLDYTKSNLSKYKNLVSKLTYYKVRRADLNKKIAGPFRLKSFICKDDYYADGVMHNEPIICIFNPKIFYKTIELIQSLKSKGHNPYGFEVINGHRHPSYNENIGGAKLSRHIKGEAVDIVVYDINNDGYSTKADKDIVLDILEKEVIGNQGGIGLYPGTDNVHYDVRGTRARWNSY